METQLPDLVLGRQQGTQGLCLRLGKCQWHRQPRFRNCSSRLQGLGKANEKLISF